jgi:CHAD domain-containing protein
VLEREVKVGAWAGMALPDLQDVQPGVTILTLPSQRLTATYYDTADLRLARWGVTVRYRSGEEGGGKWTVKLPDTGAVRGGLARQELEFTGPESRVPAAVASLVRGLARSAPLAPVSRIRTDRLRLDVRSAAGEPALEIDDDEVSVLAGRRLASRFREIEVELMPAGDSALLEAVVARLREAGAGAPDPTPKVIRALGPRALEPPDVVVGEVTGRSSAGQAVQAAIAASVERLIRRDIGVRQGDDPEDVHQARVATRRMRSDLRTFRPLLDETWTAGLREELGWIAGLLGGVRDADVLGERLRAGAARLAPVDAKAAQALVRRVEDHRELARAELLKALDSPRYARLLDALVDAAAAPVFARPAAEAPASVPAAPSVPAPPPVAPEAKPAGEPGITDPAASARATPVAPVDEGPAPEVLVLAPPPEHGPADRKASSALPRLARGPWRHLEAAVAALGPEPPDEALHEVRIRAKRCRYASEAVAPVVGKQASRLAAEVAELQGVLGDFHDAVVAEEWLRAATAKGSTAQALAAGQLIAAERAAAERGRTEWKAAWKAASARKLRTWFE